MENQVFLCPATKVTWRVYFRGNVCTPDFNSKGAAQAHLDLLKKGYIKPQYN